MTRNSSRSNPLYSIFLITFCVLASFCNGVAKNVARLQGMFIFGSSVVDNGNNNNLVTLAKANYSPYGVDFPCGPTGRFTNGKTVADLIAEHLKLPPIPAFADPKTKGDAIIHGVNFGSGGSGILDETGSVVGDVISLNEQIANFEGKTLPQLEAQLRCQRNEILSNYLFLVAAGNNDYLLNYFLSNRTLSPPAFAAKLTSTYSDQLKRLYNLGARKFALLSVYPLGCSPVVSKGKGCVPGPNAAITLFYDQLISTVDQITPQMPGSEFVIVNSVKIITDIINDARTTGFSNVDGPCCELSLNGASCRENGKVCDNRNSYVYFDGQHNTQALNTILAVKAYTSCDYAEVYPFNLHRLAQARL